MSFPTSPPQGGLPRPWDFPPVERVVVPGGPEIVVVRLASLPIVQVRWMFRVGRTAEPPDRTGASALLGATLRHGTERHDSVGLARTLDHLGAHLHVRVAADSTLVAVNALAEHLHQALDIAHEVALRPTFPEAETARERDKALESHRYSLAEPDHLAAYWLSRCIYGPHPYGHPTATLAGLEAITTDDLRALHCRLVRRDQAVLMVVGDVDPATLAPALADRVAGLAFPVGPDADEPGPASLQPRRLVAVDRPGSEQVSIALGHAVFGRTHPDYLPLTVANQVLGAAPSSRLFMELRERRSLTYGVYSVLDMGRFGGDLGASMACEPAKAADAVGGLVSELRRLVRTPLPEAELDLARRYLTGSFPGRASGVGGVAALVGTSWLHGLEETVWSTYQSDVMALSREEVERVARAWILPDQASVVVVGPGEAALRALEPLGPVEQRSLDDRGFESADR